MLQGLEQREVLLSSDLLDFFQARQKGFNGLILSPLPACKGGYGGLQFGGLNKCVACFQRVPPATSWFAKVFDWSDGNGRAKSGRWLLGILRNETTFELRVASELVEVFCP